MSAKKFWSENLSLIAVEIAITFRKLSPARRAKGKMFQGRTNYSYIEYDKM